MLEVLAQDQPGLGIEFRDRRQAALETGFRITEKATIVAVRSNSLTNLVSALKFGLGVGMLPSWASCAQAIAERVDCPSVLACPRPDARRVPQPFWDARAARFIPFDL
jgi:DNA-binding transcriptional LysR family regulator